MEESRNNVNTIIKNSIERLNAKVDEMYWDIISLKKVMGLEFIFLFVIFIILLVVGLF